MRLQVLSAKSGTRRSSKPSAPGPRAPTGWPVGAAAGASEEGTLDGRGREASDYEECIYLNVFLDVSIDRHTCATVTCIHAYICTHTFTRTDIQIRTHTHVHTLMHTHIHTYSYVYIRVYVSWIYVCKHNIYIYI